LHADYPDTYRLDFFSNIDSRELVSEEAIYQGDELKGQAKLAIQNDPRRATASAYLAMTPCPISMR
jgi:hypothetical protein